MAAGAGNEKKRKKSNFSPAPGLNPGRQLRWSSDLPERPAFQAKIPKSIVRLIMLPANIYCERRLGSHDWSRSHAFATAAMGLKPEGHTGAGSLILFCAGHGLGQALGQRGR